jgi:hypothetical protein
LSRTIHSCEANLSLEGKFGKLREVNVSQLK